MEGRIVIYIRDKKSQLEAKKFLLVFGKNDKHMGTWEEWGEGKSCLQKKYEWG